jgi:DNA-binding NarL/FixJ family response regulator
MTKRLVADLVRRPISRPGDSGPLDVLSEREREVLAEVARGKTNAEIGESLYMSPLTAKTHVSRILGKLSARDRAQLVVIGYETGLVSPGE